MAQSKKLEIISAVEQLLGGKLTLRMQGLLRALGEIYSSGRNNITAFELSYLIQMKSSARYHSTTLFKDSSPPQDALEFLSCIKYALLTIEAKYAPDYELFFSYVPLLPQHQKQLADWQSLFWTEILENAADESVLSSTTPRLRLKLINKTFIVELAATHSEPFRKASTTKLRDLFRDESSFEDSHSEAIIRACCDYHGNVRTNEFELNHDKLPALFSNMLRQDGEFMQSVVMEDGKNIPIFPQLLRWQVDYKTAADLHADITLFHADGTPLLAFLLIIPGKNTHLLTSHGIYKATSWPNAGINIEKLPLAIPKAALHSAGGLALFRKIGIPVPEEISKKIVTVTPRACVTCAIRSLGAMKADSLIMNAYGETSPGKKTYIWNSGQWRKKAEPSKPKNGIVDIDHSQLAAAAEWLTKLPFKPLFFASEAQSELRVTKNFPDLFLDWIQQKPASTEVLLDSELSDIVNGVVSGNVKLEIEESSTGIDWFDIHVNVSLSDTSLTPEEINLLLKAKGKWIKLQDKGWRKFDYTFSEETERELAEIGLNVHDLKGEKQKLHALQLGSLAKKKSQLLDHSSSEQITRRVNEIQTRVTPDTPTSINAKLRPYQIEGFHFLAYLTTNHFGGVLADDMGLGKTLQALTWLAWLHDTQKTKSPLPSLVVAPKSVQENWSAEATKFYPQLRTRTWKPGDIDDQLDPTQFDLLIINYAQLRNRSEHLTALTWLAVIVDEAQNIKNPSSQSAQCARALNAHQRLALTGTPIENRLMDLWSIFSFAMPGALGSRASFTKTFDNDKDPFARRRLSARTRPFLLRRTKNEVAKDLPERIEEDLTIELEGTQQLLYQAELKRARAHLLKAGIPGQLDKLRFHLLSSLLRLRQICCHPALIGLDSPSDAEPSPTPKKSTKTKKLPAADTETTNSGKLDALLELLEPLIEQGQKILVFSQFVSMLEIIQRELEARDWKHYILTGKTDERGQLVNDFQSAEGAAVFLISLKAGGAGLNLTAACYVVLFDPWWNPAVEAQAIDRTHRIGQKSTVIAYRLVVKNTIEQKIRDLQKQKSAVAKDILGEENFARALTLNDFHFLLADS